MGKRSAAEMLGVEPAALTTGSLKSFYRTMLQSAVYRESLFQRIISGKAKELEFRAQDYVEGKPAGAGEGEGREGQILVVQYRKPVGYDPLALPEQPQEPKESGGGKSLPRGNSGDGDGTRRVRITDPNPEGPDGG